ncbi:MAG: class I SAM-dependent methyltransferase, partial [Promethearchaeota archaeon]
FSGKNNLQFFWRMMRTCHAMYHLIKIYGNSEPGKKIICDVGCGPGIVTAYFAKRGFVTIGIDNIKPLVVYASNLFERKNLDGKFINADITQDDEVFGTLNCDAIICIDAIEHFKNPRRSIENFKRILNNSGHVFITTPNYGNPIYPLIEKAWDFVGKTPGWSKLHITRLGLNEYIRLFKTTGFEIVQAGTFFLASPFASIFSRTLGRFVSKIERYLLRRFHLGLMIFLIAKIEK